MKFFKFECLFFILSASLLAFASSMIRNTSQKFPPSLILSEIDEIELNSFVWVLRHFIGGWGGGAVLKTKRGRFYILGD